MAFVTETFRRCYLCGKFVGDSTDEWYNQKKEWGYDRVSTFFICDECRDLWKKLKEKNNGTTEISGTQD